MVEGEGDGGEGAPNPLPSSCPCMCHPAPRSRRAPRVDSCTSPALDLPKEKGKQGRQLALIAMDRAKGWPCHPSVSFRAWAVPKSHGESPFRPPCSYQS